MRGFSRPTGAMAMAWRGSDGNSSSGCDVGADGGVELPANREPRTTGEAIGPLPFFLFVVCLIDHAKH